MKSILTLCLVVYVGMVWAQSYKVLTVSPGVKLGAQPVKPGMIIEQSSETLSIPFEGFAGLVSNEGDIRLMRVSTPVTQLNEIFKKGLSATGMVTDRKPHFLLFPDNEAGMIGDSIFLAWGDEYYIPKPPRDFVVTNINDKPVYSAAVNGKHWALVNMSAIRGTEQALLIGLKAAKNKRGSGQVLIKIASDEMRSKVVKQLGPFENDADVQFYNCAIYSLNNYPADRSMAIYKILRGNLSANDSFMRSYFEKLRKELRLDQVQFD